ncbi:hypothetical protein F4778DRAFT_504593 [Xylariomycetidae sp. FL2044]|nr:hypothetical protein F4778DRAFT_504593 [Xylariomycetidae sp. FL2044]
MRLTGLTTARAPLPFESASISLDYLRNPLLSVLSLSVRMSAHVQSFFHTETSHPKHTPTHTYHLNHTTHTCHLNHTTHTYHHKSPIHGYHPPYRKSPLVIFLYYFAWFFLVQPLHLPQSDSYLLSCSLSLLTSACETIHHSQCRTNSATRSLGEYSLFVSRRVSPSSALRIAGSLVCLHIVEDTTLPLLSLPVKSCLPPAGLTRLPVLAYPGA